jgi:purine-binding chemotaxis protein CheW
MSGGPHLDMPHDRTFEQSAAEENASQHQQSQAIKTAGTAARQILRQRAAALRKKPADEEDAEQIEIVEFAVGAERYGVLATLSREVQSPREISPLPGLPAHVLGLIALRGQIMPVIDLRVLFDLPPATQTIPLVLILGSGESSIGVLADEVSGVRRIKSAEVQPMPPSVAGKHPELFSGVTADRVAVLRVDQLLSQVDASRPPRNDT